MTLSTVVVTQPRFESFDEYLAYTDDNNRLYELFNGELVQVPPESGFNIGIANFLFSFFLPIVGHLRVRGHGLELELNGEPRNRYPDLTIIKNEIVKVATWQNLTEVQQTDSSAEAVGNFTVFNIKGNRYRLIFSINYLKQIIYFKYFLTHAEYNKDNWKNDPYF
jgi:mRNA-degrading endonuclease HigB of HigAB toxin-antitoxin module